MRQLIYNAIRTPDGTVLESRHVHDFKTYKDKNGLEYMIDGGLDYQRYNIHTEAPHEDLSVYDDASHEEQRQVIKWGTYGKNGDEPYHLKKLCDMTDGHIRAVLETQSIHPSWRVAMEKELEYRE